MQRYTDGGHSVWSKRGRRLVETYPLHIDGKAAAAASGETFTSYEPATGRPIAEVARGGAEDVHRAVVAARAAFDRGPWPRLTGAERAGYLRAVAAGLAREAGRLAELETRDSGATIRKANGADVPSAIAAFERAARWAQTLVDEAPSSPDGAYLRPTPYGVVGAIIPWNLPLSLAAARVAPAIAAGNTCVVKPASFTSLTALELGHITGEAGVPAGVVNVVSGPGGTAGEALAGDPRVDLTSFTGSDEVGAVVAGAVGAGRRLRLNLAGKSANVVLADADLELAACGVAWSIFYHNGQICMAGSRAIVHRDRYADFLDLIRERAAMLRLGDPLDERTDLGPLVSRHQVRTVDRMVRAGIADGARLLCGGTRPEPDELPGDLDRLAYYRPTVLADVDNASTVAREEIFGPVLVVMAAESDEDAVDLANDNAYGLAGAVWSADSDRARRCAERLRADQVWINDYRLADLTRPVASGSPSCWDWLTNDLEDYRRLRRVYRAVTAPGRRPAHFGLLRFGL
jgi:acyl-CoA reductase-like NAD-dependent aldehyde dehydrogenase